MAKSGSKSGMQPPGAGVAGRMRAGQLAASDPTRALVIARAIPDAWYRCQALASIARAAPEKYVAQAVRQARVAAAEAPDAYQQTAVLSFAIDAALARGLHELADEILREALHRVPLVEPADSRAYALSLIWSATHAAGAPPRRAIADCALVHCDPNRGWRGERAVPALDMGEARPLRHQVAIAPPHDGGRDVAVGERVAGEELRLAELVVEHFRGRRGLLLAGRDGGGVALVGRRADQVPEHRRDGGPEHRG